MKWNCAQLESRLNGYLEGKMAALELRDADDHARACARCQEWFEARQARALLFQLEELETPPGFETRVLARTLAAPERTSVWQMLEEMWRAFLRPRVAFSVAGAVLTLALVVVALDVPLRDIQAADLSPINIYRAVDRKAHLAYASGVRYLNGLRVVYELRNQLAAIRAEDGDQETESDNGAPDAEQESRPEDPPNDLQQGKAGLRTLASAQSALRTRLT